MSKPISWEEYHDSPLTQPPIMSHILKTRIESREVDAVRAILGLRQVNSPEPRIEDVVNDQMRMALRRNLAGRKYYPWVDLHIAEAFLIMEDVFSYADEHVLDDKLKPAVDYAYSIMALFDTAGNLLPKGEDTL